MAKTLKTAIRLYDGMSPALRSMNNALNIVLNSFEAVQGASSRSIDTASIQAARTELTKAALNIDQMENNLEDAKRKQERFNDEVRKGDALTRKLRNTLATVGTAIGVKKLLEYSDTVSTTKARLNLMNDGLQTTEQLQTMIYNSAQRSRGAYIETAQAVSKLGILAKDAFKNNQEMVMFAEQLNKQFVIGGASAQEQTAATYQLTQAMAAGRLQGDEFRSIMENAPMLAQAVARELGVSVGELRNMSREGLITADVIKNAMFSSADETNAKFAEMPWTFAQAWTTILNNLQATFEPLIMFIAQGAGWIAEHWSVLEPIFFGLAGAVLVYAAALGVQTAVTWIADGAAKAFFATLLANPLLWIALVIGVIIAAIYSWIQSVGGIKIAWLIAVDTILTAWSKFYLFFMQIGAAVIIFLMKIKLAWLQVKSAIVGYTLDMYVKVVTYIQDMVNTAIRILNAFITALNKIPGVSIPLITEVSFATAEAAKAEASKQALANEVSEYQGQINSAMAGFEAEMKLYQEKAHNDQMSREMEIAAARSAGAEQSSVFDFGGTMSAIADSTGATSGNTEDLVNSMDTTEEELKYLRDLAEREAINRFTTAEITIEMNSSISADSPQDIDGIIDEIETRLEETAQSVADGDYI